LVAGVVCVGVASGCGSSSDSSNDSGSTSASTTKAASSGGSAGLATAKATVQKYLQQPQSIAVTEPLKQKPKGAIWIMQCPVPSCIKQQTDGVKAATKVLGVGWKGVPVGATPESATSAWNTAANASPAPGGLLVGAPQFETVKQQVAKLEAKKVPITAFGNNLNNKSPEGTDFPGVGYDVNSLQWSSRQGKLMADWIGVDANGAKTKVLYVTIPDFKLFVPMQQDFKTELTGICSGCGVTPLVTNVTAIATTIPKQVVSALQRDPSIKYVAADFGDMLLGVPEALKAAGLSAKLVSQSGSAKNIDYIKNGQQALDVASNNSYNAWQNIDAVARMTGGQAVTPALPVLPTQLVTKEGLDNGSVKLSKDGQVEVVANYEAQWTKLWSSAK
jgi:ABC-type sugar transport system substrate-binding protein